MCCRSTAVAEFDSADVPAARTHLPIERRDGDMIDIDCERKRQRPGWRCGFGRWFHRQCDLSCAKPANGEMTRKQRKRLPFDDDVSRGHRGIDSAPREVVEMHRRGERPGRAFD